MAMLHTVNKSPFVTTSLASCLDHTKAGSAVLLMEDGIYGAIKDSRIADRVASAMGNCKIYVLGPDVAARGISENKLIDGVTVVDYSGFVDLVADHDKVQAWL